MKTKTSEDFMNVRIAVLEEAIQRNGELSEDVREALARLKATFKDAETFNYFQLWAKSNASLFNREQINGYMHAKSVSNKHGTTSPTKESV